MIYIVVTHGVKKMMNAMRLALLVYLAVGLGGMFSVWKFWLPVGETQPVLWWVAEVILGFITIQAVIGLIMTNGMSKQMKSIDKEFSKF